jgi:hypothetical protein
MKIKAPVDTGKRPVSVADASTAADAAAGEAR